MATQIDMQAVAIPQTAEIREKIAVAAGVALLVAGLILVTAVLPAEYGLDPLGTGEALGLASIAPPPPAEAAQAVPTDLEPVRPGANTPQAAAFKRDVVTFKLGPSQGLEYKYQMEKGGSMLYSWRATGTVKFDFHGEPVGAPRGYAESYEMGEKQSADGAFFAPTSGIHGWYWENTTANPVTVTLTSAGFYSAGIEFTPTGRVVHKLSE
jgi:hypothetical protein